MMLYSSAARAATFGRDGYRWQAHRVEFLLPGRWISLAGRSRNIQAKGSVSFHGKNLVSSTPWLSRGHTSAGLLENLCVAKLNVRPDANCYWGSSLTCLSLGIHSDHCNVSVHPHDAKEGP